MKRKDLKLDLSKLTPAEQLIACVEMCEKVIVHAKRNKQSLTGNTSHAERFHHCRTEATRSLNEIKSILTPIAIPSLERTLADIDSELKYVFDTKTLAADRRDLRRQIILLVKSEIDPALARIKLMDAEFLPMEIVNPAPKYIQNIARQINGSFRCDCFDASGVMIRRLLETLIIEVFERKGIANRIMDSSGNYIMFTDLVNKYINTQETPTGRTTKKHLPSIASVLHNCAHGRTFNIGESQLGQYQDNILIAVQELINLLPEDKQQTTKAQN